MLNKQFIVIMILFFSFVGIIYADEVNGNCSRAAVIRLTSFYHHLGDNNFSDCIVPEPEGTYWQTAFRLKRRVFNIRENAFVKFLGMHIEFADLVVNGNRIRLNALDLPDVDKIQLFHTYIVPIPFEMLLEGRNILGIEANRYSNGNYDDFFFGELEIWFQ